MVNRKKNTTNNEKYEKMQRKKEKNGKMREKKREKGETMHAISHDFCLSICAFYLVVVSVFPTCLSHVFAFVCFLIYFFSSSVLLCFHIFPESV